jgi:hypothetical protein
MSLTTFAFSAALYVAYPVPFQSSLLSRSWLPLESESYTVVVTLMLLWQLALAALEVLINAKTARNIINIWDIVFISVSSRVHN